MIKEKRNVRFDKKLQIEAYQFEGIMQKFPNHFHEYYVIGFIEKGKRYLSCKNQDYEINSGDIVIFNPLENHTCEQIEEMPLDYRSLNIQEEIMAEAVQEITGEKNLPVFSQTLLYQDELVSVLKELHQMIMNGEEEFRKEELFYILIETLIKQYTKSGSMQMTEASLEIRRTCYYIDNNFEQNITLDELGKVAELNKYTLLRNFTRQKGVTPYQYLEVTRVNHAKHLLEKGIEPIDAAMQSGFTDQSHFTRFFKNFIGLTPKQYLNIFRE